MRDHRNLFTADGDYTPATVSERDPKGTHLTGPKVGLVEFHPRGAPAKPPKRGDVNGRPRHRKPDSLGVLEYTVRNPIKAAMVYMRRTNTDVIPVVPDGDGGIKVLLWNGSGLSSFKDPAPRDVIPYYTEAVLKSNATTQARVRRVREIERGRWEADWWHGTLLVRMGGRLRCVHARILKDSLGVVRKPWLVFYTTPLDVVPADEVVCSWKHHLPGVKDDHTLPGDLPSYPPRLVEAEVLGYLEKWGVARQDGMARRRGLMALLKRLVGYTDRWRSPLRRKRAALRGVAPLKKSPEPPPLTEMPKALLNAKDKATLEMIDSMTPEQLEAFLSQPQPGQ